MCDGQSGAISLCLKCIGTPKPIAITLSIHYREISNTDYVLKKIVLICSV